MKNTQQGFWLWGLFNASHANIPPPPPPSGQFQGKDRYYFISLALKLNILSESTVQYTNSQRFSKSSDSWSCIYFIIHELMNGSLRWDITSGKHMHNYTNTVNWSARSSYLSICWSSSEKINQFCLYTSAKTQWSLIKHFFLPCTKVLALHFTNPEAVQHTQAISGLVMKSSRSAFLLIELRNFHTDVIINEAQQLVIGWL